MPILSRSLRALAAATLVVATLLATAPAPASALEPPRPLPGYRPRFVTETDTRPMIDCLWASGAMLLDKWTNGDVVVSHERLRRLSGDGHRGSTLDDLKVAYRKLGFNLKFSPDGGTKITFRGLLRRLAHGAGAVVLGDDSQLPRWYGRWDYGFWQLKKKEKAIKDNHAVYVERYDRKHHRVWLMDPLAHGNWKGEWISTSALRAFAWSSGGALYTAVTPTAKAAPFSGVRLGGVKLTRSATTLDLAWSMRAPRGWRYPGVDTRASFVRPDDPLLAAVLSPDMVTVPTADKAPSRPTAGVDGRSLVARMALPTKPGAYVGSIRLTDRRFGRTVAAAGRMAVFVPGLRRATIRLHATSHAVQADRGVAVSVSVANTGDLTWANASAAPDGGPPDARSARNTQLVAHWIPLDPPGRHPTARPDPIVLRDVPLETGERVLVSAHLPVPDTLGRWALVVDVEDDVDGSFAALGSAPDFALFEVVAPRGFEAAD